MHVHYVCGEGVRRECTDGRAGHYEDPIHVLCMLALTAYARPGAGFNTKVDVLSLKESAMKASVAMRDFLHIL